MNKLVKVTGGTKYVLFRWGTKYAIVTHRCNNFAIVTNLVFLFSQNLLNNPVEAIQILGCTINMLIRYKLS